MNFQSVGHRGLKRVRDDNSRYGCNNSLGKRGKTKCPVCDKYHIGRCNKLDDPRYLELYLIKFIISNLVASMVVIGIKVAVVVVKTAAAEAVAAAVVETTTVRVAFQRKNSKECG